MSRKRTQPTAEEAQTVLDQIERVIRWSDEFRLAFVKCNSPLQQEEMRRTLLARLNDKQVFEISLQQPIVSLLDELTARWDATQPPDAVCVYGLEKSIGEQRESSSALGRLNHDRDLLRRTVPAALLIWLPDFALDCVARGAPDFWAWRSGVYEFPTEVALWQKDSITALAYEVPALFSLSLGDKQKEIARLEELLRTAHSLSRQGKQEQKTVSRLLFQIGLLYYGIGEWNIAQARFEESLGKAQQLGDQQMITATQHHLGVLAEERGQWEEAEQWYQRNLATSERLDDTQGQAVTLHQLGNVSLMRGQVEEAERRYQQSLALEEHLGNAWGQARTFHQLGRVAEKQGRLEEAERWYRQSLAISEHLLDMHGQAITLHQLGKIALLRGNLEEAERWYHQSLTISVFLGDAQRQAQTFHQLGVVAQEHGNLEEAERWYRQSLAISERLGGEYGQAASFHQLGRVAEEQGLTAEAIQLFQKAEEIFARLGNPQDLDMVRASLQRVQRFMQKKLTETNEQAAQSKLDKKL